MRARYPFAATGSGALGLAWSSFLSRRKQYGRGITTSGLVDSEGGPPCPSRRPHDACIIPRPPKVAAEAGRAVRGVLRRRPQTCLVQAVVLQRWHAALGDRRDVVVGVTALRQGFHAHAWLEGEPACHAAGFVDLLRSPAP